MARSVRPTWQLGCNGLKCLAPQTSPFRYFNPLPEVIHLVVLIYLRFPLSLRNVEDLLLERGIDLCHATVRMLWNRFGPMFAATAAASG